jgi:hypothetical protein
MTKGEFLRSVPYIITHNTRSYGELEIIVDTKNSKGVCYRHLDNTASCGSYASTWAVLYKNFSEYLIQEGYMFKI